MAQRAAGWVSDHEGDLVEAERPGPARRRRSAYEPRDGAPAKTSEGPAPIFRDAGTPSRRAVVRRDLFGHARAAIDAESAEAASHWRVDDWRLIR